jgi:hypothetical protein
MLALGTNLRVRNNRTIVLLMLSYYEVSSMLPCHVKYYHRPTLSIKRTSKSYDISKGGKEQKDEYIEY